MLHPASILQFRYDLAGLGGLGFVGLLEGGGGFGACLFVLFVAFEDFFTGLVFFFFSFD